MRIVTLLAGQPMRQSSGGAQRDHFGRKRRNL